MAGATYFTNILSHDLEGQQTYPMPAGSRRSVSRSFCLGPRFDSSKMLQV